MNSVWLSALISTILVSLISLIGVFLLFFRIKNINKLLLVLVSFSIGALLGNTFFHLIPESYESIHSTHLISWLIIIGFLIFFLVEQFLHSYHNNSSYIDGKTPIKHYGYLSLYADGIHNFTDGILIGAAWMVSPEIGISSTIAIMMHEIPQEISDFGILIKAGFTKKKALLYNFLAAFTAVLGTILTLWIGYEINEFSIYILPVAAGGFIYLGATGLLPELLKDSNKRNFWFQFFFLLLGFLLMFYFSLDTSHYHYH